MSLHKLCYNCHTEQKVDCEGLFFIGENPYVCPRYWSVEKVLSDIAIRANNTINNPIGINNFTVNSKNNTN